MDYKPPPGPPPGYQNKQLSSNNPYKLPQSQGKSEETFQPPPGPPPSHYEYQAPPGPPPGHELDDSEPPPYAPWLAVPDNALLPPPPAMRNHLSFANNASEREAEVAEAWCKRYGLWAPRTWTAEALQQIQDRNLTLSAPPGTRNIKISASRPGSTLLNTSKQQSDLTVLSNLPLLVPQQLQTKSGAQTTIYYEVNIKRTSGKDATVALGFVAPPYPPGRLPGWHRGSLAVHNDDGHRFVNDDEGGIEFVGPFGAGERIGLGMTFTASQFDGQPYGARVFFTRNGQEEGSWDLHESRDADTLDGGVSGLDGTTDLYAAIGVSAGVELEVNWAI